ncbi:hypothetical protein HK104_007520 [Borealophlyctis nickersoniae]|nr:hypothetical protein HK104_007520 [Borealophlyctis nickersoniae]
MPASTTEQQVVVPLPPPGAFMRSVRTSCRALSNQSAPDITIDESALPEFIRSIDATKFTNYTSRAPLALPLKFDSLEQEINFVSVVEFLGFGSGWDKEVFAELERDTQDVILFGVMSMHISSVDITARFMRRLTITETASFFGIPLFHDTKHSTLPMTISEPHPLRAFAQKLTSELNEAGRVLEEGGYRNMAQFVLDDTKVESGAHGPSAERFVGALVTAFAGLRDADRWNNLDVYIFKRAQTMALNLYRKFHSTQPTHFNFGDIDSLTVTVGDSGIPSILNKHGIIKISPEMEARMTSGDVMAKKLERWDLRLRGVAVDACVQIVEKAKEVEGVDAGVKRMNEEMLDAYLWGLVKEGGVKKDWWVDKETVWY